jgi:hypothetical protein
METPFSLRGLNLETGTQKKKNITSATTLGIGSVVQCDILNQTTLEKQIDGVVLPTTAGIAAGRIGVCANPNITAGTDGDFWFGHEVVVIVKVTGTIAKGDPLKAQNNSDIAAKATAGTDRYHFIALEAQASGTGTIKAILRTNGTK